MFPLLGLWATFDFAKILMIWPTPPKVSSFDLPIVIKYTTRLVRLVFELKLTRMSDLQFMSLSFESSLKARMTFFLISNSNTSSFLIIL